MIQYQMYQTLNQNTNIPNTAMIKVNTITLHTLRISTYQRINVEDPKRTWMLLLLNRIKLTLTKTYLGISIVS